jgi:hypothetical protein
VVVLLVRLVQQELQAKEMLVELAHLELQLMRAVAVAEQVLLALTQQQM